MSWLRKTAGDYLRKSHSSDLYLSVLRLQDNSFLQLGLWFENS